MTLKFVYDHDTYVIVSNSTMLWNGRTMYFSRETGFARYLGGDPYPVESNFIKMYDATIAEYYLLGGAPLPD